jgi:SIR2-like protein
MGDHSTSRDLQFNALAEALLVRHLQVSWPDPTNANPRWFRDGGQPRRYGDQIRTVAVVGAGASLPMQPIAEELASRLENEFDKDPKARDIELDRLENVYGLDRKNFETRLTAVCRTTEAEREVKEEISKRYRLKHPTLLPYELLAHLLHHRFLDMIVSFNFDELLDQSIEDELGRNEYTRVVSEGDFDPNHEVQGPLYVKMHGTATEPETLRFTRERYYWTPRSIVELVEKRFSVEHLVLINLGFTMGSFDFQRLLRKPQHLEIYHFDPCKLKKEVVDGIVGQRRKARERGETSRPKALDPPQILAQFPAKAGAKPGAEFLEDLLGKLDSKLQRLCNAKNSGPAGWRSIMRHEAVVKLLDGTDLENHDRYTSYLRRRTILEIAFTAAKGRGVVSIASMIDDRCGRYYDRYLEAVGREKASSWSKLCELGGLVESPTSPDTYEILEAVRRSQDRPASPNRIHQFHLADPRKLAEHTAKSLSLPGEDKRRLTSHLTKTLEYLQRDTEIEIHSCDDRVCSKLFSSEAKPLTTLTAFQGWTREMLIEEEEFDELCLVAETGYWITDPEVKQILGERCKRIRLLQAFDAGPKIEGVEIETRQLPWQRHNRHMTIACSSEKARAAIYFVRRLRSATVTPVFLRDAKDLSRVKKAFEQLWIEAEVYEEQTAAAVLS